MQVVQSPTTPQGGHKVSFPQSPARGINGKALAAIIAGSLLFIGGAVALIVICFSPGKQAGSENKEQVKSSEPPDKKTSRNKPQRQPDNTGDKKKPGKGRTNRTEEKEKKPPRAREDDALRSVLSKKDQQRVSSAVEKGIRFLKTSQAANGSWPPPKENNAYLIGATPLCRP